MKPEVARLLDVNLNRVREGLRVCEEIARFIWERQDWFLWIRKLRHQITTVAIERMQLHDLIMARNSKEDIGRGIDVLKRETASIQALFLRNLQRVKEGLRVLEEFTHEMDPSLRQVFQTLRYQCYDFEKEIVSHWDENQQLSTLRHSG